MYLTFQWHYNYDAFYLVKEAQTFPPLSFNNIHESRLLLAHDSV